MPKNKPKKIVGHVMYTSAESFNQKRSAYMKKLKMGKCGKIVIQYHGLPIFELKLCPGVKPPKEQ